MLTRGLTITFGALPPYCEIKTTPGFNPGIAVGFADERGYHATECRTVESALDLVRRYVIKTRGEKASIRVAIDRVFGDPPKPETHPCIDVALETARTWLLGPEYSVPGERSE